MILQAGYSVRVHKTACWSQERTANNKVTIETSSWFHGSPDVTSAHRSNANKELESNAENSPTHKATPYRKLVLNY